MCHIPSGSFGRVAQHGHVLGPLGTHWVSRQPLGETSVRWCFESNRPEIVLMPEMPKILKIPVHGFKQVTDQSYFLPPICFSAFCSAIYTHTQTHVFPKMRWYPPRSWLPSYLHLPTPSASPRPRFSPTLKLYRLCRLSPCCRLISNEKLWCVFETGELGVGGLRGSYCTTVDGSEIRLTHQLRLVVFPVIQRFFYIPGGAGFPPSNGRISCCN